MPQICLAELPRISEMGLTFHYHGRFNKNASLSGMIDEVKISQKHTAGIITFSKKSFQRLTSIPKGSTGTCMEFYSPQTGVNRCG